MDSTFKSGERLYSIDKFGVIHQEDAKPFMKDYAAVYASPEYKSKEVAISALRVAWVIASYTAAFDQLGIDSLVDVGYGNGAFLKAASRIIPKTFGCDISSVNVPEGSRRVMDINGCDVVTFWDSLEHHESLEFLRDLRTKMIALSAPWYHHALGEPFEKWKHRKPDEHLHHFSPQSLSKFMDAMGWRFLSCGRPEDLIRIPTDSTPNILSATFVRKDADRG